MKNQLHPEPDYLSNDIKRARSNANTIPTLAAILFFVLLAFLASQSNAAEKPTKLSKSVHCAAISKKSGLPCKNMTYAVDSLCRVHKAMQAKKGGAK